MHIPFSLRVLGLLTLSLGLLAACATSEPEAKQAEYSHVATIEIDSSVTKASLRKTHKADVVMFEPDLGIAVLGFTDKQAELTTLSLDHNESSFKVPELGVGRTSVEGWRVIIGGGRSEDIVKDNRALYNMLRLPKAHKLSKNQGEGITVAVIDTGIDLKHPMFKGRLASRSLWRDFVDDDRVPQEERGPAYGHGTGVAGLVLQVAPEATILPIRIVSPEGSGTVLDLVGAIIHAYVAGADIINISLGTDADFGGILSVINAATKREVKVISSVGNTGKDDVTKPAEYASEDGLRHKLLGIASIDMNLEPSDFSSYGESVSAAMPGNGIVSAYPDNRSATYRGTSFSAPLYAGALALAYSDMPVEARTDIDGLTATFDVEGPDRTWSVLNVGELINQINR